MALLLPQPKERRKNRAIDKDVPPDAHVMEICLKQNLVMRTALARIANITKREIPDDDECRRETQDIAHKAITDTERIR